MIRPPFFAYIRPQAPPAPLPLSSLLHVYALVLLTTLSRTSAQHVHARSSTAHISPRSPQHQSLHPLPLCSLHASASFRYNTQCLYSQVSQQTREEERGDGSAGGCGTVCCRRALWCETTTRQRRCPCTLLPCFRVQRWVASESKPGRALAAARTPPRALGRAARRHSRRVSHRPRCSGEAPSASKTSKAPPAPARALPLLCRHSRHRPNVVVALPSPLLQAPKHGLV